eukprot:CAMPEP_0115117406 /NCGR_PEP_ID=MMETSP0227-20121206/43866_1 /TAXON_ID=89957 /ORGANISM="Polarella glacialis, Strain CCMP 1383" /LENGTH=50 /DNA_ID=CAMNT_0002518457 /DNA_START=15 /DNA_END=163 /DNA_ORIENTATION=+
MARHVHVRPDAAVGAVGTAATTLSDVHLDVLYVQVFRVQVLELRVALGVL